MKYIYTSSFQLIMMLQVHARLIGSVFVFSSVFEASVKVNNICLCCVFRVQSSKKYLQAYADGVRHVPCWDGKFWTKGRLNPDDAKVLKIQLIVNAFSGILFFQLNFMSGNWSLGKFALTEAETLFTGISNFIENEGYLDE